MLSRDLIPLMDIPTVDELVDSRDQVATPEIARLHYHVAPYASKFPPFESKAHVSLLIGTNNECALGSLFLIYIPCCTGPTWDMPL